MQERVVFRAADAAAAGREHCARALAELGERGRLPRAEGVLSPGGKDVRDRHACRLNDLRVAVEHRAVQPLGEQRRDGALAAAGHADEDDVLHLLPQQAVDAQDLRIVDDRIGEHLTAALGLRHEHVQPARARDAEAFRLQQQRRARGVIDDVKHARALRELPQVDGGFARVRIHADRRGVDDHVRVGVAVKILVIIRPVAGDDRHVRAELLEHGLNGRGRAAVAEHKRLLPRDVDAAVAHEVLEAEGIGIVAVERAVRPADEHVHAAEPARDRRELGAVRDDRLLIRDGYVERVKIAAGQKRRQVLRRDLIEPVGIVGELRVDGRRIAVAELFAQKSAPHHHTTSR